jgi:epoxyqueuosine reductase
MTPTDKSSLIKSFALDAGFERVGVVAAGPIPRADSYRRWLAAGRAGTMQYLHRHADVRVDPRRLLPGARSVIVVAHNYRQSPPDRPADGRPRGRVAMYAWGRDYHRVMKKKLRQVVGRMRESLPEPFGARICVDTVPLLERELAAAAGIGWIGKNTMVLNAELGSYFFLGEIVTTLDLAPDAPLADQCGRCTRCLEACPTGALDRPYEMDATRCISYLTIEHRDVIDEDLKPLMDDWVYGCDICQDVCPHNHQAPETREPAYAIRPPGPYPALPDLLAWSEDDYANQLRGSAMKRATPEMLRRNAEIISNY